MVALELYKLLKFRTPYCVYEIFNTCGEKQLDLNIHIPQVSLQCQKQSFTYQSSILWNKFYKRLIVPFTIPLHQEYIKKHNLTNCLSVHYDYSNKVSLFKSNLSRLLLSQQSLGNDISWLPNNK